MGHDRDPRSGNAPEEGETPGGEEESEPTELPLDGTLDLHTFHPRDVKQLVPDYITACLEEGITSLRIVHGKGTGTLREIVHSALRRDDRVESFQLAGGGGGGWGATLVELIPRGEASPRTGESDRSPGGG